MEPCNTCKKKTHIGSPACKCGKVFCGLHRAPEDHHCDFNFKKAHAAKLNQDNQRIVEDKLATRI